LAHLPYFIGSIQVDLDFPGGNQVRFFLIHQEVIMLEVTSSAVENLKTYLAQNNIDSAVRIALMQGG